jgi:hypothetical protein
MALVTLQMIFQDVFQAYAQDHPLPAHVRAWFCSVIGRHSLPAQASRPFSLR